MKFYRKRKVESTIDMTPMLDTLLQVHIAFMFLMSFAASSVKLDLPRAAAGENKAVLPVVVSLDASNQMHLNEERIAPEDLGHRLAPLFEKSGKREVLLRADQSLAYKHILKAIRTITHAGAAHVHLAYEDDR